MAGFIMSKSKPLSIFVMAIIVSAVMLGCGPSVEREETIDMNDVAPSAPMKHFMVESVKLNYRRCFSLPEAIWPVQESETSMYFKFKDIRFLDGAAESPGLIGSPYTSAVTVSAFRDMELKSSFLDERFVSPAAPAIKGFALYERKRISSGIYIAVSETDPLVISYQRGEGMAHDLSVWVNEIETVIDFLNKSAVNCKEH